METIDSRLPITIDKGKEIFKIGENPQLMRITTSTPISEYETRIIPQLLNNAESWLGLNDSHIEKLQNFQVFQVSAAGTPKGMLILDGQMLGELLN